MAVCAGHLLYGTHNTALYLIYSILVCGRFLSCPACRTEIKNGHPDFKIGHKVGMSVPDS